MDSQLFRGFLKHTLFPPENFQPSYITLPNGINVKHSEIGVVEVTPPVSEKAIIISSGIHGDETAPVELVDDLVGGILEQQITPKNRVLFIIAHPKAIHAHTRFIKENLNRLFTSLNPIRNEECTLANRLQEKVKHFFDSVDDERWHFDLHCAIRASQHYMFGVVPASTKATDVRPLIAFLKAAHMDAVLLSQTPSSTFSWFSAENYGAMAATFEMGRVAPLYQNNMAEFVPLREALIAMLEERYLPQESQTKSFSSYKVTRTITKTDASFQLAFSDDTANFTFFQEGELLAEENGVLYHALPGGEAVVFPNANVAIGQRAALLVQPFEPDDAQPLYVNVERKSGTFAAS
ncbi:succinylglutamate desuccinylase [Grimontia hollisae]|uniref:Succinylglutamate desuccinylase n=1 Tax=Grimontia hollisae TaxID=673 RepID=A0A377HMB7_GRIHO|nr:succinylglutamate desuccinylase [Grimontia hollisae]STO57380.1 Succinylglutamate desuccinylase [Grimontia hollisae]STQ75231.1 Succinylglutamate desuccinylase [Grimontia hollisae]